MEERKILLQHRDVEVQQRLTGLHHPTLQCPNVATSPGAVYQILRIKAKIAETTKGERTFGCE